MVGFVHGEGSDGSGDAVLIRIIRASLGTKVWTVGRDVDERVVGCGDAFDGHVVLGEEYIFELTNSSIGRRCGGRSGLV